MATELNAGGLSRGVFGWPLAVLLAGTLAAGSAHAAAPSPAPAAPAAQSAAAAGPDRLFGEYLAGHHAQQVRDFAAAAGWYQEAIADDPGAPELISRTFLMEVCVGDFDRARARGHWSP